MIEAIYEAEYLEGIEHFNACEFFEAHEAWENLWARTPGPSQLFYKGLIHAAVALHHFGNQNLRGAHKVFASCLKYLTPYSPSYMGLDLEVFLSQMRRCFAGVQGPDSKTATAVLDEAQIPRISLVPPATIAAEEG